MGRSPTRACKYLMALGLACQIIGCWKFPALAQTTSPASQPSAQEPSVQQAIHDYIIAHPEVIIESLRRAKARAEQEQGALIKSKIAALRKELVEDPDAPVLGNPKGDVTLVEFFDYRCPYCRQVEPWLQTLIREDSGVRLVEKELPILGPASVYAARVALAANKQGKHTEFRNALMTKEGNMDEQSIHEDLVLQVAQSVGLDIGRMNVDMKSPEEEAEIQDTMRMAQSLGFTGTPAFIVGNELVPGATDLATFRDMILDARRGRPN
jgi:protein-disulfide isomerase